MCCGRRRSGHAEHRPRKVRQLSARCGCGVVRKRAMCCRRRPFGRTARPVCCGRRPFGRTARRRRGHADHRAREVREPAGWRCRLTRPMCCGRMRRVRHHALRCDPAHHGLFERRTRRWRHVASLHRGRSGRCHAPRRWRPGLQMPRVGCDGLGRRVGALHRAHRHARRRCICGRRAARGLPDRGLPGRRSRCWGETAGRGPSTPEHRLLHRVRTRNEWRAARGARRTGVLVCGAAPRARLHAVRTIAGGHEAKGDSQGLGPISRRSLWRVKRPLSRSRA